MIPIKASQIPFLVLLIFSLLLFPTENLPKPHIVIIGGDTAYNFRQSMAQLANELETQFDFQITLIDSAGRTLGNPNNPDKPIPNMNPIERADLLVLNIHMHTPPQAQLDLLERYFKSGKPSIGIGTPTNTLTNNGNWARPYFGGHYWHQQGESLETYALPSMAQHPILRGVPRHELNEGRPLLSPNNLSNSTQPLVLGRVNEKAPSQTLAWINEYKFGSRQFVFAVGKPEHLDLPGNRSLFYNAIFWTLGREVPPQGVLGLGNGALHIPYLPDHPEPPLKSPPSSTEILFQKKDRSSWGYLFGDHKPGVYQLHHQTFNGIELPNYSEERWGISDRSVAAATGYRDIATRKEFSDYRLTFDFLVPLSPGNVKPIWRGNSGVYLNGRYEIQILDCETNMEPSSTSCGAINGIKAPDDLTCAPAGTWQNMEIVFKAARFEAGKKITSARTTVTLNGKTIHENVEIPSETISGFPEDGDEGPLTGPIRLQADSSAVQFANIWLKPLSEEQLVFYFPQTKPKTGDPWLDMDYGPFLTASIEAPWPKGNIAYKGIAIPMNKIYGMNRDEAVIFDTDLLRYSVGWKGDFVNLRGVPFDGTHQTHPEINGEPFFANPVAPGWAKNGSFKDPRSLPWGPLPKEWAHFSGLYLNHNQVILSYTVGETSVLEIPSLEKDRSDRAAFVREINLEPSDRELILQVAAHPSKEFQFVSLAGLHPAKDAAAANIVAILGNSGEITATAVQGLSGARWLVTGGNIRLVIPAREQASYFKVFLWKGPSQELDQFEALLGKTPAPLDLQAIIEPGPLRWRKKIVTQGVLGPSNLAYTTDTITWPVENPWNSWMRFGGFDFFADGHRAAICTWNGDVWTVTGIDTRLEKLTWQRIATGLFQPLGLRIVDDQIYVLGRDQITILHDLNDDGEIDFYENFNNDHQVTEHFHEFAMDLQRADNGDFYYMKGGRHALDSLVPRHGTLIRVSKDGSESEIVANGFRAPNGLLITPKGEFISSDQQGHWVPANRINLIKPGGFYGYMWSYHEGDRPTQFDQPIAYIHPSIDRSPASFIWVNSDRWGPFQNRIISPSYGMGKLELILREDINGIPQGGLTRFPVDFETGIMRGQFHPNDGQLYLCGLFGWAGNKTRPGGFYRIRYTHNPVHMPTNLQIANDGAVISFTQPLDPSSATDPGNYHIQVWNYRRTELYGSPDFRLDGQEGRDKLEIKSVTLSRDRRHVFLKIPKITPIMQMHIDLNLKSARGQAFRTFVHNTIHKLGDDSGLSILGEIWSTSTVRRQHRLSMESPGLIQEIRSISSETVEPDIRPSRLLALYVDENSPPSSFLEAGQFRSRWRGFLKLDLNEELRFYAHGRGDLSLRIEGEEVTWEGGTPGILDGRVSTAVPLLNGLNQIEVDYTSPPSGPAVFRLSWSSDERLMEPIPPTALTHEGSDVALQERGAVRHARQIFAENRCTNCHLTRLPLEEGMPELHAPRLSLSKMGTRLKASWIYQWIQDPIELRSDARMPKVLSSNETTRQQQALDISSFLMTLRGPSRNPKTLDDLKLINEGAQIFENLGCIGCHSFINSSSEDIQELLPLNHVPYKWQKSGLIDYLLKPEAHDSWSRMPNFSLSLQEASAIAAFMFSAVPNTATEELSLVGGNSKRGQKLVMELGCLNCHQLGQQSTSLKTLTLRDLQGKAWSTGCLAPLEVSTGKAPRFEFTEQERRGLSDFLKNHTFSLNLRDWTEFVQRQRKNLRCASCHELDLNKGRWSPLVDRLGETESVTAFSSAEETIHLKIPPLTWAGEKLRPEWTEQLITGRLLSKVRPRMKARMPSFPAYGPGFGRGLAQEHGFEPITQPRPTINQQQVDIGRQLIESDMLGCIDCHSVGNRAALAGPDTETINFQKISGRLRYSYFWRFLQDPQRILPGTMMPTFMDGHRSTLPSIYRGDARRQADALWNYIRSLQN